MDFTFFSSAHGTFSRIDHILGHKSRLIKKKVMISSIFSDHNAVRLDISHWVGGKYKNAKDTEAKQHAYE